MSAKKVKENNTPTVPTGVSESGPKGSASWEEHGERVRVAVAVGTSLFTRVNEGRIAKASSAEAAKSSYVSGMIDMLSVARNALGFWGADQILMELERMNGKRISGRDGKQDPLTGPAGRPEKQGSDANRVAPGQTSSAGGARQEVAKVTVRDPMFA
jgi:hypothetical protein